MDWTEVSDNINIEVQQWHELVSEAPALSGSLPSDGRPGRVVFLSWQSKSQSFTITEFTQNNLVAAIGALTTSVPPSQRLNPSDMFLPADALTDSYALAWTMAALFSHATVALNSVAGPEVSISESSKYISPTVIVGSAIQGSKLHQESIATPASALKKLAHHTATQALQAGRLPVDSFLTKLNAPKRAALGTAPGKLRLLFLSETVNGGQPALSGEVLSDLRVYTGARVAYALEAPGVAGAVAQGNIYDYRTGLVGGNYSGFGAPVASVEVRLRDNGNWKTTDKGNPYGQVSDSVLTSNIPVADKSQIVVSGPAVVGNGEKQLGALGTFTDDQTLAYIDR